MNPITVSENCPNLRGKLIATCDNKENIRLQRQVNVVYLKSSATKGIVTDSCLCWLNIITIGNKLISPKLSLFCP